MAENCTPEKLYDTIAKRRGVFKSLTDKQPEAFKPLADQVLLAGVDQTYTPKAMETSQAEGEAILKGLTPEQMVIKVISRPLETDADVAAAVFAMKEIQDAAFNATGDEATRLWEAALTLTNHTSKGGTSLGQAINMFRMIGALTPEGVVKYGQRLVEKAREADPNKVAKVKDFTKKANKPIKVDPNQLVKDLEEQLQKQTKLPKPQQKQDNALPGIPEGMAGFDVKAKIDEAVSDANKVITDLERQLQKQTELPKPQAPKQGLKQPDIPEGMGGLDIKAKIDEAVKANNKKLDDLRNRVEKETGVPVPKPERPPLDTLKYPKVQDMVKAALAHLKKQRDDMLDLEKLLDKRTKGGKPIKPTAAKAEDLRLDLIALAKKYSEVRNLTVAQFEQALVDEIRTKLQLSGQEAVTFAASLTDAMTGRMGNAKQRAINNILKAYDPKKPTPQRALVDKFAELANLGIVAKEVPVKGGKLPLEDIYAGKFVDQATTGGRAPLALPAKVMSLRVNLRSIVKQHYTKQNVTQAQLVKQIAAEVKAKQMDISPSQINEFATAVHQQITASLENARKAELNKLLEPIETNATARATLVEKFIIATNLKALDDNKTMDLLADKLKLPKFTPEQAKALSKQARKAQTTEGFKNRTEQQAILARDLADLVPPDQWDKIETVRVLAMLSSPKTPERNIAGNVLMQALELPARTLAAGVDKLVSKATGQRTMTLPQIGTFIRQGNKGRKQGIREWELDIDTRNISERYSLPRTRTFKTGVLGALEKYVTAGLRIPDAIFYQAAYGESLRNQQQLLKMAGKPVRNTEKMKVLAELDARFATLTDDSVLSQIATGIKQQMRRINPVAGVVTNAILPFAQVPANLVNRGLAYSPVGLVKSVYHLARPLMTGDFNQREFVLSLSRAVTGSVGGVALGYYLAMNGVLTGERPSDKTQAEFEKAVYGDHGGINLSALARFGMSGLKPQVALDGDKVMAYTWAQPVAGLLAAGASLASSHKKEAKEITGLEGLALAASNGVDSAKALLSSVLEIGMLQGVQTLVGTRGENGQASLVDGAVKLASDYPGSFVPAVIKQVARVFDAYDRETKGATVGEQVVRKVSAGIPFASMTQPKKASPTGEDVKSYGDNPINRAFQALINPAFISTVKQDALYSDLLKLKKATGETSHLPKVVGQNITVVRAGKEIAKKLTAPELADYERQVGVNTATLYQKALPLNLPNGTKQEVYAHLKTVADRTAKESLFKHEIQTASKGDMVMIKGLQLFNKGKKTNNRALQIQGEALMKAGVVYFAGQRLKQSSKTPVQQFKRQQTASLLKSS